MLIAVGVVLLVLSGGVILVKLAVDTGVIPKEITGVDGEP